KLGTLDPFSRARTAHPAPRSMAGGAERALHGPLTTRQHEARSSHGVGDEHGLPGLPVVGRDLVMAGRKCPGGSLSMHTELPAAVGLELGDVVGHVVDLPGGVGGLL